jgi:hypothetical protein
MPQASFFRLPSKSPTMPLCKLLQLLFEVRVQRLTLLQLSRPTCMMKQICNHWLLKPCHVI